MKRFLILDLFGVPGLEPLESEVSGASIEQVVKDRYGCENVFIYDSAHPKVQHVYDVDCDIDVQKRESPDVCVVVVELD